MILDKPLPDARKWLLYAPEQMSTRQALWLMPDILDYGQAPVNNCSVAAETNLAADVPKIREFLECFSAVFIADLSGEAEAIADLLELGGVNAPILTPAETAAKGCRSLSELRDKAGPLSIDHLLLNAVERPIRGILRLSDVPDVNRRDLLVSGSGFRDLDCLTGGFCAGELSVWTGKRGSGKSTLVSQMLLRCMDQDLPVCAYSGELTATNFKAWAMQQAAGPAHVTPYVDKATGEEGFDIRADVKAKINTWWQKKFFLYDNRIAKANEPETILTVLRYAVERYGCAMFLVDNLMSAKVRGLAQNTFDAQSEFVEELAAFAKRHEVHVHLVSHPRKGELHNADDIAGSGDIANRADMVFALTRTDDEDGGAVEHSAVLEVFKSRHNGRRRKIWLEYDPRSRRYYRQQDGPYFKLGWERQ